MSSISIRLKPEELRSLSFGGVSGTYAAVGTGFSHPIILLQIVNDLNADILISFFNEEDHVFLKAGSFILIDAAANKADPGGTRFFDKGTIIQVKQASGAASSGSVYVAAFYGADQ